MLTISAVARRRTLSDRGKSNASGQQGWNCPLGCRAGGDFADVLRWWEMMGRMLWCDLRSGGHHSDHGRRTLLGQQGHCCLGRVLSCTLACQISSECHCCDSWSCLNLETQIQASPLVYLYVPIQRISKVFQLLFWRFLEYSQFSRHLCEQHGDTFLKQCLDVPRWEPLAPARHGRDCLRPLQQAGVNARQRAMMGHAFPLEPVPKQGTIVYWLISLDDCEWAWICLD